MDGDSIVITSPSPLVIVVSIISATTNSASGESHFGASDDTAVGSGGDSDCCAVVVVGCQLSNDVVRATGPDTYEYRLLVQKQPGIDTDVVSVSVRIPPETEVTNVSPEPTSATSGRLGFEFPLNQDTELMVSFRVR